MQKIITIFSDPDLARRLGKAGRKRAEDVFDKKRMAKDFIKLSKQLIRAHKN